MLKNIRVVFASLLVLVGVIFFIIPGSMFLVLGGLMLLSYDFPSARSWLKNCQRSMSGSAQKLDRVILNRKFRS